MHLAVCVCVYECMRQGEREKERWTVRLNNSENIRYLSILDYSITISLWVPYIYLFNVSRPSFQKYIILVTQHQHLYSYFPLIL